MYLYFRRNSIKAATMYRLVTILLFVLSCIRFVDTKAIPASYCKVSDKTAHFDFNLLSESADDNVIVDEKLGASIRLRLCGPLSKTCNDLSRYSICLTKDNAEKGIGKSPPDSVVAKSGQLVFKFTGDPCDGDTNYSVQIIMKCDYEAGYDSHPELIPHESDQCAFYMVWKTKAACDEEHTVECTAIDKDHQHYDLSSLISRSENYMIPVAGTESVMILNVCHSVIYDNDAVCTQKSGACLREKGENESTYTNLGDVINGPYFEDGVLALKYETGQMCVHINDKYHVDTIILFECDYRATNSQPEYEGGATECLYKFRWKTAAACSVESLKKENIKKAKTCKVTNPLRNIEYNFHELMSKDFHVKSPNGTIYTIQICGKISSISCPDSGVCDVKNKISMGKANTNLRWSPIGPYLNYTDGAECAENRRRYTQIVFLCGTEESIGTPVFIQEKDCALIIHWKTSLACDKRINCETKYGKINLTSLIRRNDNYVVKTNDSEFNINVCRQLVPKPHFNCLHGSAVCQMFPDANARYVNETNLGYPDKNPFIDEEKHVILRYTGGSPCPEDKSITLSSNLTFLCNYSIAIGEPRYKYYRNCTHVFEWPTSVVCENIEEQWKTGCIIKSPDLLHTINLTSLAEKSVYKVKSTSGEYNLSLCDKTKFCNGSAVCKGNISYGSSSKVIFDYTQHAIILKFSNGTQCKTGFYSSEVRLICDESAGNGEPTLMENRSSEISCSVIFEWRTKVVCVNQTTTEETMSDVPIIKESVKNIEGSESGHVGKNIGIGILVSFCVAVIIYLWSSERRAHLRSCFSSLTTRRERCRAQYTKVNATEEARLLLDIGDSTHCQTDSDSDDELLDA